MCSFLISLCKPLDGRFFIHIIDLFIMDIRTIYGKSSIEMQRAQLPSKHAEDYLPIFSGYRFLNNHDVQVQL